MTESYEALLARIDTRFGDQMAVLRTVCGELTFEVDKKNVRFRDTICSLTSAALKVMREMGYDWDRIQGPKFWKFENEILVDRRSRLEQE